MQEIIQFGGVGSVSLLKWYRYSDKQLLFTDDIVGTLLDCDYARICSNNEHIFVFNRCGGGWDVRCRKIDKYGVTLNVSAYGSDAMVNHYVQGATIVNNRVYVLTYRSLTQPNYLHSLDFNFENILGLSGAIIGKALHGLWFDGTDLWVFNSTDNVLEKRQLINFATVVETIPNPVTGFICYEILPDENTGYIWLNGILSGNPYVCVYDPISKVAVSSFTTPYDLKFGLLPVTMDRIFDDGIHIMGPTVITSDNVLIRFKLVDYNSIPRDVTALQYSLYTAWNLSTASYASVSFAVGGQDGIPTSVAFKPDGTKMYMVGLNSDRVYQYSLSTAWNLSTASYDLVNFLVSGQDTQPRGIAFKPDGTKMYMVGIDSDRVHQYSLSAAWNLSTASYDSVNFLVGGQDTTPISVAFKPDGTKMYMMGYASNRAYQYSLSTAWNLSTASYDSVSFLVSGQDIQPHSIAFKPDGTKMYMVGITSDRAYQYSLSTAWNLSTASYDSVSFLVSGQDTQPHSIAFKPDGTKMYMMGYASDRVYQYPLSIAWNLSTASYDSDSFLVSGQEVNPYDIAFKPDGTKLYIVGIASDRVHQYSLSTAWNLPTASYDSVSFLVDGQDTTPTSVAFKPDGTKMYMMGYASNRVHQYSLSAAWNLSTASYDSVNFLVGGQDGIPTSVAFKPDGTKMYMVGLNSKSVYQYSLSTAWNLSTVSYDSVSFSVIGQEANPRGIAFKPDGTKMYMVGIDSDRVHQYSLSAAWNLSTASYDSVNFLVGGQDTTPTSVAFKPDGTKMYMMGYASNRAYQYSLGTADTWMPGTLTNGPALGLVSDAKGVNHSVLWSSRVDLGDVQGIYPVKLFYT